MLESGKVLFLPQLSFLLLESERGLLTPTISNGKTKNVSLRSSGEMSGASCAGETADRLRSMMQRFAETANGFVRSVIPAYENALERASTSYRPVEIEGRASSAIHDDTRLHVDAFPSRPMRGRRILRLFSNVHPGGAPRIWRVGEPFDQMATRFLPGARAGSRVQAWLLRKFGITRETRSAYDGLMLALHDGAKRDLEYQRCSPQTEIAFPAGSTWLCFTDQVMHAARAGQYVLEQTFHLDVRSMVAPDRSPLRMLERLRGRALT
ncbi:MAG: Kdo hydroxylase family protein [Rhizomicrobium sp.]